MATCPECTETFADDVQTCPTHGCALVPDELVTASDAPLKEGTMVGEYRIEKKLGAGTFGDVYAGEQPVIGKRVAVKVLNRRFASDPVMVSRFVAEARAVNKIRQRNIIDIFSFGVVPGIDRHYFVMELLDGLTLGALLHRTGALPVALVLPIVRGIADALDAVHEAGITHRDLKPDNVFLAKERDGTYFPKLLDFGIAKLVGDDTAHKTGSGMVLGTPRYMSPEQARGKPADHRADVYALGVMIHEMLTGGPLFVGDSAVDMLLKHAVDDPPGMSSVLADLPPELDEPVLAMLEKRPQDRPATAGKAVAALAARARQLGLDRVTGPTLAELAMDDSPTRRAVPQFPQAAGTTVTIRRTGRVEPDPLSKTERAPASQSDATAATPARAVRPSTPRSSPGAKTPAPRPAAEATLASNAEAVPASSASSGGHEGRYPQTPGSTDPGRPSSPSTESVSTVETASAIGRRSRARRFQLAVGATMVLALAFSTWALGRNGAPASARVSGPPIASSPVAPPLPSASSRPRDDEPTVKPEVASLDVTVRLATRPGDVEVWLGNRRLGSSSGPLSLPRGAAPLELRLKKPGFDDKTVAVTPDRDQTLETTLSPRSPGPSTPGAGKASRGDSKLERVLGGRE